MKQHRRGRSFARQQTEQAVVVPAVVQFTIGNIVEPKVLGKSMNLHPVVVMLTLVLFGVLWGIPGMFLATPMTGIIKIVLAKREFTRPVAKLLEGDLSVITIGSDA